MVVDNRMFMAQYEDSLVGYFNVELDMLLTDKESMSLTNFRV